MREKMREGDVLGRCPRCSQDVAVYAMGSSLRVRAHTRRVTKHWRTRAVPCPVQGVDGADALDELLGDADRSVTDADRVVTAAEASLTSAKGRAAKVRAQRDEYAAKVADLKARVAGKGGAA